MLGFRHRSVHRTVSLRLREGPLAELGSYRVRVLFRSCNGLAR